MPAGESEFARLMRRLREGDQEAAWTLIEDYGPHIRRIIRRELNQKMRSKFDSVDFVQAAWASFFRQPNQFRALQSPQELLSFLVAVARNKLIDETRRRMYLQKMNVLREEPLDDLPRQESEKILSSEPRPSQVAVAREQWHRLMASLPDENRQVLELRFAGATYEEIGAKLNMHERTVRRIMDDILEQAGDD